MGLEVQYKTSDLCRRFRFTKVRYENDEIYWPCFLFKNYHEMIAVMEKEDLLTEIFLYGVGVEFLGLVTRGADAEAEVAFLIGEELPIFGHLQLDPTELKDLRIAQQVMAENDGLPNFKEAMEQFNAVISRTFPQNEGPVQSRLRLTFLRDGDKDIPWPCIYFGDFSEMMRILDEEQLLSDDIANGLGYEYLQELRASDADNDAKVAFLLGNNPRRGHLLLNPTNVKAFKCTKQFIQDNSHVEGFVDAMNEAQELKNALPRKRPAMENSTTTSQAGGTQDKRRKLSHDSRQLVPATANWTNGSEREKPQSESASTISPQMTNGSERDKPQSKSASTISPPEMSQAKESVAEMATILPASLPANATFNKVSQLEGSRVDESVKKLSRSADPTDDLCGKSQPEKSLTEVATTRIGNPIVNEEAQLELSRMEQSLEQSTSKLQPIDSFTEQSRPENPQTEESVAVLTNTLPNNAGLNKESQREGSQLQESMEKSGATPQSNDNLGKKSQPEKSGTAESVTEVAATTPRVNDGSQTERSRMEESISGSTRTLCSNDDLDEKSQREKSVTASVPQVASTLRNDNNLAKKSQPETSGMEESVATTISNKKQSESEKSLPGLATTPCTNVDSSEEAQTQQPQHETFTQGENSLCQATEQNNPDASLPTEANPNLRNSTVSERIDDEDGLAESSRYSPFTQPDPTSPVKMKPKATVAHEKCTEQQLPGKIVADSNSATSGNNEARIHISTAVAHEACKEVVDDVLDCNRPLVPNNPEGDHSDSIAVTTQVDHDADGQAHQQHIQQVTNEGAMETSIRGGKPAIANPLSEVLEEEDKQAKQSKAGNAQEATVATDGHREGACLAGVNCNSHDVEKSCTENSDFLSPVIGDFEQPIDICDNDAQFGPLLTQTGLSMDEEEKEISMDNDIEENLESTTPVVDADDLETNPIDVEQQNSPNGPLMATEQSPGTDKGIQESIVNTNLDPEEPGKSVQDCSELANSSGAIQEVDSPDCHKLVVSEFNDVEKALVKLGFSFPPGKYCKPGVDPEAAYSTENTDYFTTEEAFRAHLCQYGVKVAREDVCALDAEETVKLTGWIRTYIVSSTNSSMEYSELEWKEASALLEKIGFTTGGTYYILPGIALRDAVEGTHRFINDQDLLEHLARCGLPQDCKFEEISPFERLSLEMFITTSRKVQTFVSSRRRLKISPRTLFSIDNKKKGVTGRKRNRKTDSPESSSDKKASKKRKPQGNQQAKSKPKASPKAKPKASPKTSPKASPKTSSNSPKDEDTWQSTERLSFPKLEDVRFMLEGAGYSFCDGKFVVPTTPPVSFSTEIEFRKYLCRTGIVGDLSTLKDKDSTKIRQWVRFSIVKSLHKAKQYRSLTVPEARKLITALGFQTRSSFYCVPGLTGKAQLGRDKFETLNDLQAWLARHGLPENCSFNEISPDDLLSLELFLADCHLVETFLTRRRSRGSPSSTEGRTPRRRKQRKQSESTQVTPDSKNEESTLDKCAYRKASSASIAVSFSSADESNQNETVDSTSETQRKTDKGVSRSPKECNHLEAVLSELKSSNRDHDFFAGLSGSTLEKNLGEVTKFLKEAVEHNENGPTLAGESLLYVCGPPGVGKSSGIRHCVTKLKESVECEYLEINATTLTMSSTTNLNQLLGTKLKEQRKITLTKFLTSGFLVVVLDEIDMVLSDTKKNAADHFLERLCQFARETKGIVLICVSNSINNQKYRRLCETIKFGSKVTFGAYSKEDLIPILETRIRTSVIHPAAMQYVAAKTANTSGDVRSALKCLESGIEFCIKRRKKSTNESSADQEGLPKVTLVDIVKSNRDYVKCEEIIENHPTKNKIVLCTAFSLVKRDRAEGVIVKELVRQSMAALRMNAPDEFLEKDTILQICEAWEDSGILQCAANGWSDSEGAFCLGYDLNDMELALRSAVKDIPFFEELLPGNLSN